MGFYRYTEEDIGNIGAEEILSRLEEGTKREIELILQITLIDCLTAIADCESPIERMLGIALNDVRTYWETLSDNGGLNIYPQMDIVCGNRKYRADFQINTIVNGKEKTIVVECDGHEFHEKTKQQAIKDRQRERDLTKYGYTVVRFTGSEIFNDPYKCVREIKEILFDS